VLRSGDRELRDSARSSLATILPGSPTATPARILAERSAWMATIERASAADPPPARRAARRDGKLRVAYLSAFFGARHWMKPVFGALAHHDRARFEIHWIADGDPPSAEAGWRDAASDVIWPASGLTDRDLAQRLADAGIDVLVDLNGWSHRERFGLLLRRPAPVQLGWFNHFATSGCPALDALIGDAETIVPGEERHVRERLLRVPGSCYAFDVNYPVPPVAPPPCLGAPRDGSGAAPITFGCLGSAYKITPQVVASWSRILRAAPAARLLLKNPTLADESNREALARRFDGEGIARERLRFEAGGDHFDFLRGYDRVDVALDTFPYNGGTTTTEALWQGVPVATFDGERWSGRTSRSLLVAAGLAEWVAPDRAAFEARFAALAADPATPARLAELRSGMRARLQSSRACDTQALCRALEAIYESEAARRS
jgi:predicted O-linked N-acetylglucosamine transferase (SPINDLY family)